MGTRTDRRWYCTRPERILLRSHSTQTGPRSSGTEHTGTAFQIVDERQTKDAVDGCFRAGPACCGEVRLGH